MATLTSKQRVDLGKGAGRVALYPGVPAEVPDDQVDALLDAHEGFGRRWLDLGVLKIDAPKMEPTESQITRAVSADEASAPPAPVPLSAEGRAVAEAAVIDAMEPSLEESPRRRRR